MTSPWNDATGISIVAGDTATTDVADTLKLYSDGDVILSPGSSDSRVHINYMSLLTYADCERNQLRNMVIHNVANATARGLLTTALEGQLCFQADTNALYICTASYS